MPLLTLPEPTAIERFCQPVVFDSIFDQSDVPTQHAFACDKLSSHTAAHGMISPMMIGYARVSTDDQKMDLQIRALERVGCDKIYSDHGVSGRINSKPGLDRAIARLKPCDTLVVWRLDRLGRSLPYLVRLMETLGRRHVEFYSITEHINTQSSGGKLVFHMMAALAEFERTLISERTRAGIAAARESGKLIGRRPILSPKQISSARKKLEKGIQSEKELANKLGVHIRTLQRALARI